MDKFIIGLYLTLCFQIGKVTVAEFPTIKCCLRNSGQNGKVNSRPSNNTLVHFIVTVIESVVRSTFLYIVWSTNLFGSEFFLDVYRILCSTCFFRQWFRWRSYYLKTEFDLLLFRKLFAPKFTEVCKKDHHTPPRTLLTHFTPALKSAYPIGAYKTNLPLTLNKLIQHPRCKRYLRKTNRKSNE